MAMPGDDQQALELLLQLRSLIRSSPGGSKDLVVLHRVRDLCALATQAVSDLQSKIKLGELENYADALFSDRKNQQWPAGAPRASCHCGTTPTRYWMSSSGGWTTSGREK